MEQGRAGMAGSDRSSGTREAFAYDDAIVRLFAAATIVWGVVGMLVGIVIALQLAFPALNLGEQASFGRLRPVHTNAVVFAFAGNAVFAGIYYATQRLCGARMYSDVLGRLHFWGWQAIVVAAAATLPMGLTQGKDLAEPEWLIDIAIAVVWVGFFGVNFFGTLARRRERRLGIPLWFFIAAIVAFAIMHVVNSLSVPVGPMKSYPVFAGVLDALLGRWYRRGAIDFLLMAPFLGMMYFFLPRAAGRPVYSYRLAVVHFWSLVFLFLWSGAGEPGTAAIPTWLGTLGAVFSVMLWMPAWGGAINGLLTLRGARREVAQDPVLKFFVLGLIFYALWTFEGAVLGAGRFGTLTSGTDWAIARVHTGALGWNGFMVFGMLYWVLPRIFQTRLWSVRLSNAHVWVATAGVLLYVLPMYAAGAAEVVMRRAFDASGDLAYPAWIEMVGRVKPLYWVRAAGGLLYLAGAVMCLLNFAMTWANGPAAYETETHSAPAPGPRVRARRPSSRLHANTGLGHAGDRVLQASWHRRLESRPAWFAVWVAAVFAIGGLVEAVPMFAAESSVPAIATVRPYTPLELAGRDIYIAEGCHNCHSQMIRPLLAETMRFGAYSRGGESVYDRPSQWGSRRIGPDLAREGESNANAAWHFRHFMDPGGVTPGSIMPPLPWLYEKRIDFEGIQRRVDAMAELGVPYGAAASGGRAAELARAQARQIAASIEEAAGPTADGTWDRQVVALIAYIQRLGTDLNRPGATGGEAGHER
jgi:cytochrome c oxidase cbb3-type subunit I/II